MTDPEVVSDDAPRVRTERRGHVLIITLDRVKKRNAADLRMLHELALAYGELDRDPELRVGLVNAAGDHFTAGLDLADIAPRLAAGELNTIPDGGVDPWGLQTAPCRKPVIVAVQGSCFTLGIELALASEVTVAAESTRFSQAEVARGIMPFGGATLRFPRLGWGNAMQWVLTGAPFDAAEALRIGLVQSVVPDAQLAERSMALADAIAAAAPLAVQTTLANARQALVDPAAAVRALPAQAAVLAATRDARHAAEAYLTRQPIAFEGR